MMESLKNAVLGWQEGTESPSKWGEAVSQPRAQMIAVCEAQTWSYCRQHNAMKRDWGANEASEDSAMLTMHATLGFVLIWLVGRPVYVDQQSQGPSAFVPGHLTVSVCSIRNAVLAKDSSAQNKANVKILKAVGTNFRFQSHKFMSHRMKMQPTSDSLQETLFKDLLSDLCLCMGMCT